MNHAEEGPSPGSPGTRRSELPRSLHVGAAGLNGTSRLGNGAEELDIFGTVLHASGAPAPVRLPTGATLVTTLVDSRTVLTNPSEFRLPQDVSREPIRPGAPEPQRTTPLPASEVELGRTVFVD